MRLHGLFSRCTCLPAMQQGLHTAVTTDSSMPSKEVRQRLSTPQGGPWRADMLRVEQRIMWVAAGLPVPRQVRAGANMCRPQSTGRQAGGPGRAQQQGRTREDEPDRRRVAHLGLLDLDLTVADRAAEGQLVDVVRDRVGEPAERVPSFEATSKEDRCHAPQGKRGPPPRIGLHQSLAMLCGCTCTGLPLLIRQAVTQNMMSRRAQRASRGGAAHFFSAGASVAAWNARALMADSSRCAPSCVRHAIGMIICARAPPALGSGPGALGRWPTPELRAWHRPTRWRTGEAARSPPSHQVAQRARSDKRPHSVRRRRQAGPEAGPCLGRECILLSLGHLLHVRLAGRQLRRRRRQPRRRAGRPHRARHQAMHVGAAKAER